MKECPYCNEKIKKEEQVLCPITGKIADTSITLYKWNFYLIMFEVQKIKLPVSSEIKKIHHQKTGTWWELINIFGGDILINIPLFGGILILISFIYLGICLIPLWVILDLFYKKEVFGRGLLKLNSKGEVLISRQK